MKFQTVNLPVAALEVCGRTRVRKLIPQAGSDIVIEYADAYRSGLILEPLDVFREKGTERCIVADGEHRLLALLRAKIAKVECRLYEGDEDDAFEFAAGCNQKHGLRRTKADIYHAFVGILERPRLADKYRTDTQLSDQLGISIRTVQSYRAQWRNTEDGSAPVRAKKKGARARAEKHDPTKGKKGNMQTCMSQPSETTEKVSPPARTEANADRLSAPADDDTPPVDVHEPSAEDRADYEAEMERESREYFESIDRVMQSDDRLATAQAEIKRLGQLVESTERSRDGFMNGKAAVIELLQKEQATTARQSKLIDHLRREIEQLKAEAGPADTDALQQQIERLLSENAALRERIAIMEEAA